MTKIKNIIYCAAVCFSLIASLLNAAGTTSATFLKLGVGARPVAMGSAFTGISDDVNAVLWNPGGLVNIEKKEFSFMHLEHFQGIKYNALCYALPFEKSESVLASGAGYLYTDDIAKTFIDEDVYSGYRDDGSFYRLEDKTFFVSFARMVAEDKALGVLVRWLSERIDTYEASGVSFDIGYLMLLSEKFSLGLSVQNIGGTIRFISVDEKIPLILRAGIGYTPYDNGRLKVGIDISKASDYQPSVNCGVEYILIDSLLALRGGWRFKDLFFDDRLDDTSGLSLGVGLSFYKYSLDYAFVPYGILGYSHRISLSGRF